MWRSLFGVLILLVVMLISTSAYGQNNGAIIGVASDASGAMIPGVEVTATNQGTNQTRQVVTNEAGNYRIEALQVGVYTVSAELPGFRKMVKKDLKVDVDARLRVDFSLEVGAVSEVVEVTGTAPVVQTDTSQLGQVVEERKIVELPLNGRNFSALAYITPGTFAPRPGSNLSERGGIAAVGVNERENGMMLDGAITNSPQTPEPGVRVNLDAIAEFKVQTQNYSANYGRFGGAIVDAITKSGTNEFHGSAFGFGRSTALDARNFFEAEKVGYTRSQYGAVLGGPIIPDKVFFFTGIQIQRQEKGHSSNPTIPLPAFWEGNLSQLGKTIRDPLTGQPFPNAQIPRSRIHPISLKFRQYWDGATLINNNISRNARASFGEPENYELPNVKINLNLSDRHQLIGAYTLWNHSTFLEWSHAGRPEIPRFQQCCGLRDQAISIQDVLTISNSVVNEFRAAYPRNRRIRVPEQHDRNIPREMGILGTSSDVDPIFWGPPKIFVTGYSDFGRSATVQNRVEGYWSIADIVSIQKGNHALKIGGDFVRGYIASMKYYDNITGTFNFTGSTTGDAFADFLLGYMDSSLRSPPTPGTPLSQNENISSYSLFFQDDWKASRSLTLNLGFRYDLTGSWKDKYDMFATFDPNIGGGRGGIRVLQKTHVRYSGGIDLYKSLYPSLIFETSENLTSTDRNNVSPRFGFAWTPGGRTSTVVRGAYGIFYVGSGNGNPVALARTMPFTLSQRFIRTDGPTWDNPWPGSGLGAIAKDGYQYNVQTPYYGQWNLGLQQEMPIGFVLDLAWVGKKGTHLQQSRDINQPINGVKPFPLFGTISFNEYRGNSIYHGLQSRIERRASNGATVLVSYQWGKMISDAGPIRNVYNLAAERGLDAENVRHRFASSFVTQIPSGNVKTGVLGALFSGWELSGILRANTGATFTPTVSQDFSGSTRRADRPDLIGDPKLGSKADPKTGWWNRAAFALPARGTYGNAGVGILEGPGYIGVDGGLMKRFAIGEDKTLQFRWEIFNVFNHTNFFTPNAQFDSQDFGTIGSAFDARQMQAAVKFIF